MNEPQPLLEIRDLAVSFDAREPGQERVKAVDGSSLTIFPAQTLAVVGESGCGKSVSALTTLGLIPKPQARVDRGSIRFRSTVAVKNAGPDGLVDLLTLPQPDLRAIRGNEIAMIFQEPMTSLNPVMTVGEQIIEAIVLHQNATRNRARELALAAMKDVGIPEPTRRIDQYPHQFSGGMRQRVMIAMVLSCQPRLLLADEPTTALDVTIQAQILELLRNLKQSKGLAIMLITHDLGVVAENADVVAVMYAGRVVEYATVFDLFKSPLHPYTRALLACIPKVGQRQDRLTTIREIIEDEQEFTKLAATLPGARPWWPGHAGASGDGAELVEITPDHWVSVRAGLPRGTQPGRHPNLPFVRAMPVG
jgi:ABC-type dipeptide/oligopeptide/nickel transport system ATPase component